MLRPELLFAPLFSWHTAVLLMVVALLLSVRTGRLRYERARRAAERRRLRAGILAELGALRTAYRLAEWGRAPSLPGRTFWSFYRGNMPRVLALTEAEVEALVRAHAASEALDAAGGLRPRGGGRHGRLVAVQGLEAGDAEDFERLGRAALGNAEQAIRVLTAAAERDVGSPWASPWTGRFRAPPANATGGDTPAADPHVVPLAPPARARAGR